MGGMGDGAFRREGCASIKGALPSPAVLAGFQAGPSMPFHRVRTVVFVNKKNGLLLRLGQFHAFWIALQSHPAIKTQKYIVNANRKGSDRVYATQAFLVAIQLF